jgi:hypothetical protein
MSVNSLNNAAAELLREIGLPTAQTDWKDKAYQETSNCSNRQVTRGCQNPKCHAFNVSCSLAPNCEASLFVKNNRRLCGDSTDGENTRLSLRKR